VVKVTQRHRKCDYSIERMRLLIRCSVHGIYAFILYLLIIFIHHVGRHAYKNRLKQAITVQCRRYSKLSVESRKFLCAFGAPVGGEPSGTVWRQKTKSPSSIVRCCLRDAMLCRFGRTLTCDRRTDGGTDTRP